LVIDDRLNHFFRRRAILGVDLDVVGKIEPVATSAGVDDDVAFVGIGRDARRQDWAELLSESEYQLFNCQHGCLPGRLVTIIV
jgi:hypothetical protein